MKKLIGSTLALLGLFAASVATATVITETYSYSGAGDFDTNSTVTEGEYTSISVLTCSMPVVWVLFQPASR